MRKLYGASLAAVLCLIPLIGCTKSGPPAEVEGVVKYDGQDVVTGIISFLPADGNGSGGGGAIKDGKYRVYPEAALKPGKYRVEIRWGKPTGEKKEAGYGQSPDVIAEAIPEKYNAQSELTAELKAGMNTIDYKLEK